MKLKAIGYAVILCLSAQMTAKEIKKKVDIKASKVVWQGQKKIVNDKHNGEIKIKEGFVSLNEEGIPQSAEIIIDMKTITNTDVQDPKYNKKLVGHLSGEDFFDVKKFPKAILTIKNFALAKDDSNKKDQIKKNEKAPKIEFITYKAYGDLKIRDKKNPIIFDVKVFPLEGKEKATGNIKIDRTLWDVKYGSGKFFKGLGDKVIADEIELDFNVVTK